MFERKVKIAVRVEKRNDNHIKAQGVLLQYIYKGYSEVRDDGDYVWVFVTILNRDERQLYRDIEVMKLCGMDIRG